MNDPKISVIIPTYNRRDMLCQCVDSILAQTYENKEIIIVDDCSTDGTGDEVKARYGDRVRYYKNGRNMGCFYSRRFGFDSAEGELAVFVDDDDYYIDPDFFKKAAKAYVCNCSVALIGASSRIETEANNSSKNHDMGFDGLIKSSEYLKDLQIKCNKPDAFATIFVRDKIKTHVHDMKAVNDAPLCMRALLSGDAYLMRDVVGVYRMHGSNISYDLSVDFLIENLDEKKYIADEIRRRNLFDDADEWLYRHFILTAQYFINGRGRTKQDIADLARWCRENLGQYADKATDEINRRYRKRKLRNAAKKVKNIFKGK